MLNLMEYKHKKYGFLKLILADQQVYIPVNEIARIFGHARGYQAAVNCTTTRKFRIESQNGNGDFRLYVNADELNNLKRKRMTIDVPEFEKWIGEIINDFRSRQSVQQPNLFSDIMIAELQRENNDLKEELNKFRSKMEWIRGEIGLAIQGNE